VRLLTHAPAVTGVRLVGNGATSYQGRVEVQATVMEFGSPTSAWHTICGSSFNFTAREAGVVCSQLGLPGPAEVKDYAFFGEGTTAYIVEYGQRACGGGETSLGGCNDWLRRVRATAGSQSSVQTRCDRHVYDVGVVCTQPSSSSGVPVAAIVAPIVVVALGAAAATLFVLRRKQQANQAAAKQPAAAATGAADAAGAVTAPGMFSRVGEASAPALMAIRIGEASSAQPAAAAGADTAPSMATRVGEASSAAAGLVRV
jgi:hypothetical protein